MNDAAKPLLAKAAISGAVLYALGFRGIKLFAGALAGAALLEKVTPTYKVFGPEDYVMPIDAPPPPDMPTGYPILPPPDPNAPPNPIYLATGD